MIIRCGHSTNGCCLSGDIYDSLSLNRYAYVRNNPVDYADPSGMFSISAALKSVGTTAKKAISSALKTAVTKTASAVNTATAMAKDVVSTVKQKVKSAATSVKKLVASAVNVVNRFKAAASGQEAQKQI